MKKQTAMIFSAGLFLIAIAFFFIFMYNDSGKKDGSIVMPQGSAQIEDEADIAKKNQRIMKDVTVTSQNVKSVISLLTRPESYALSASVKYYYGEEETEFAVETLALKGFTKTSIAKAGGDVEKEVVLTPLYLYSWGESKESYYKGPRGDMTAEDGALMPTYESILELDDMSIAKADTRMYKGKLCIFVESVYEQGRFAREWYVDVDSGLLYGCETKENGAVIYRMARTELSIELQDSRAFMLPSGVMPEGFEN